MRITSLRMPAAPAALSLALLFAGATFIATAAADGCFLPPYWADVWTPDQKALILYDEDAGTEDLILQVKFYGNSQDFAWIVPLPTLPELDTAGSRIFYDCSDLTQPLRHERGMDCGLFYQDSTPFSGGDDGVEIYSEESVGIYQTMTLGASDASALADSLAAWGYLYADNQAEVEDALQFYIDKSWCFVAMRIDSSFTWDPDYQGYWAGGIDPIRFSFESAEPVYPMRISALSAGSGSHVLLYVCASHRMDFEGAETEYANLIEGAELDAIGRLYDDLGQVITQECFLTKLRKYFPAEEMSDDVFPVRAPDDREFRQVNYTSLPLPEIVLLAMIGVTFAAARRMKRKRG